ncbi:hypothetical protein HRI_004060400 [Hibiscus trionum]|uniref:RNase H type-1 domain-containing protein n=1 Tax=Hibiscus trionum TaxID=183268 RepID=A0A9W7MKG8_HIBTR|nr:hypothetical protein HRI_004060400 [Hibiscus trionum]
MERLGHLISNSVSQGSWIPLRFIRHGNPLSHLFFADDLILYARADISQAKNIRHILHVFGASSGHQVSSCKTTIYFSPNTAVTLRSNIASLLGYQVVDCFEKYLGVPVINRRTKCSDYDFILDKIKSRLSGWAARTLSLAGRITLAKSVIQAIPVYFMQATLLPKTVCLTIEKLIRQFIWGSNASVSKLSLVNWDSLCQPLKHGGLGLRRIHDFNIALIMKVGFSILTNTGSLWIKLLREKYRVFEALPADIHRQNCTPLWRAITQSWDVLKSGIAWSLGSGTLIHPLHDVWISALGPLSAYLTQHNAELPSISFSDLVADNGEWDRDQLMAIFHPDVIPHILGIKTPRLGDANDQLVWRLTPRGNFETKSAYGLLTGTLEASPNVLWRLIWKAPVPQRLHVFLWVLSQNKLMTNHERYRRHIGHFSTCPRCNLEDETILHVLRDCSAATAIWNRLLPASIATDFYRQDAQVWLLSNLSTNLIHGVYDLPWPLLFISTLWQLWKSRNDYVFNGIIPADAATLARAVTWATYYRDSKIHSSIQPRTRMVQGWGRPNSGWVALNVDAAVAATTSMGAIGGTLRNDSGQWLLGFQRAVGACSTLHAELWAIYNGLQLAWRQGYDMVQIQSDCTDAVRLIHASQVDGTPGPLIRAIANLRRQNWTTTVLWVPRESNRVADMLAKTADPAAFDLQVLELPPSAVLHLLHNDAHIVP